MNESNTTKKAVDADTTDVVKAIADHSYLSDFEGWLDRELEKLESGHADFATTKSNRVFFKRS